VPFGIKADDRTRHVYVIGKTGMGKSTLLENMAVQDIKNGNGLAFIDPHGQTAETLLDYIPAERKDDVVYFAPFDTENPVSFNVMEDVGEDQRHLVVSGLMSVFKKIWVDAWSARMEYILSNTILALLEYPDSTLLGVNRMLSDKEYRMRVIENITDPAVKSFWVDEFLKYNERYMQEAGDAIKNKIGQFTSNPLIRNIIGQSHSSFDIREIMDKKKILIMNLSKGLVGDQNANLLGSMLTTRIYLAAMSRANLSVQEMKAAPNFYFYVDEFQSFANATFADILSEARKYKLNLTIAHQYIEQMEEEVRNAVFGNVGTIISFRVGPFDAEVLETVYTPTFLAPDIVNLGFAQIYLTLMIDGIGSQPFSAVTLPPIELSGESCKDMVVARSRDLYSKKREAVETVIHAWHAKNFSNKPPYIPKHMREGADANAPSTENSQKNVPKQNSEKPKEEFVPYKERMAKKKLAEAKTKAGPESKQDPKEERAPHKEPAAKKNSTESEIKTEPKAKLEPAGEHIPYKERMSKKSKNLDDLRSVLKGISVDSTDAEKSEKSVKSNGQKDEATLKSALAAVLQKVETSENNVENTLIKNEESEKIKKETNTEVKAVIAREDSVKPQTQNREKFSQPQTQGNKPPAQNSTHNHQKKNIVHNTHTEKEKFNHHELSQKIGQQLQKSAEENSQQNAREQGPQKSPTPVQPIVVAGTPAVPEKVPSAEQQEYAQMKNIDDPLSVKKLERMMRTNTSDKPPIK